MRGHGHVVLVAAVAALAVACLAGALAISDNLPGGSATRVEAVTSTAATLAPGAQVVMAGVRVGRVADVRLVDAGTRIALDISDDRVLPLPEDSTVEVRSRTPIGESYVSITRGQSSAPLPDDQPLTTDSGHEHVDVDQVLSVLQGATRRRARRFIRASGSTLAGHGDDLNDTLRGTTAFVDSSAAVLTTLSAARGQTASLIRRLGDLSDVIHERDAAIRAVAEQGLVTFTALATRDDDLKATLDELPPTLAGLRDTARSLDRASIVAVPVLRDAAVAARQLTPAIARLQPAADRTRQLLLTVGRGVQPLRVAVEHLGDAAPTLHGIVPDIRRATCELNPMLRYLKPYAADAISTVIGLGSAANSYDAVGHLIRLSPVLGENSLAGLPAEVQNATGTLTHAGLLGQISPLSWNPYPPPGKTGTEAAGQGHDVTDAAELKQTGFVYPRVKADC
jgi:phospholipid/cholesterol/gamma-HCH transport system substrate-binding protein